MVDVIVKKTEKLSGEICAPPSKSYTQRMLIAASLSNGISKVSNPLWSVDTKATLHAVTALGALVKQEEECWTVARENPLESAKQPIECGESGATLRFMIPIASLAPDPSLLVFDGSFKNRPIEPLLKSLDDLGAKAHIKKFNNKDAVLVEGGGILGGETSIPGDISSQFISGLMFACPLAKVDTEITISTPLESEDYVKMTLETLSMFGIRVDVYDRFDRLVIPANQVYKPCDCKVPGDFSSAAFLLAAAAITNSKVKINNLDHESQQGDTAILGILSHMGVEGKVCEDSVEILGTGDLQAVDINAKNIPDLVPVCAILACYAKGTTHISNAKRLKLKESDRLAALHAELSKMGAKITIEPDGLTIKGLSSLHGAVIDPHNDHRVAMACAVAALRAEGQTTIQDAGCVRKSYPQFFTSLKSLGAEIVGGKFDR